MRMAELLKRALEKGASDLHLSAGVVPTVRVDGQLQALEGSRKLLPADTLALAGEVLSPQQLTAFQEARDLDFSHSLPELGRFRMSLFYQRGAVGMVIRIMGSAVLSLEGLGLPAVLHHLLKKKNGLILITGPSGSGKSTSLAAAIADINENSCRHIITLEDPLEYLHAPQKSIISQREMGIDSRSYADALRSALRQDPDIIMVGEMRDLETIATVIKAAETGHLVLTTLHTMSAPQSIDRIIDFFPAHQQGQIRIQLANTLVGVISQLLLARNGGGRVLASEVLVVNAAVRNLIREGKVHQINTIMQISGHLAMNTMDASLKSLLNRGMISREDAAAYSLRGGEMERKNHAVP